MKQLPDWCLELKKWGWQPSQLAARLDCPISVILAAYKGDEAAFDSLLDGSASKSGKGIMHPMLTPFRTINPNRRKRPGWMSRQLHKKLFSVFE